MYYFHWTMLEIEALDDEQLCEAYQNLVWIREEEEKAQKKANKTK
jgi:TPP-dependent pyruvate/acetoin dehydrogenase alpha subunit